MSAQPSHGVVWRCLAGEIAPAPVQSLATWTGTTWWLFFTETALRALLIGWTSTSMAPIRPAFATLLARHLVLRGSWWARLHHNLQVSMVLRASWTRWLFT